VPRRACGTQVTLQANLPRRILSACASHATRHAGVGLNEAALQAALDECLVTLADMEAGFRGLPDPFEPWPDIQDMIGACKCIAVRALMA
jgi:hypothetical protein